ncbi:nucleotidyltransferase family protein [Occallatibacter savannae]|uniref:nucleotidyltransferase family protein n=1 Tax=Occallatibacter savannae TaxID=1002691 RepID=UPI000D68FA1A|nr:nucleotidyltransferase family protein [Occallatibacter savannae]
MILAAGLGTRLRPLTDDRPKALVEVAGRTLLELTLARLKASGVVEVIINTHHFADKVADYLSAHHNFGMNIEISREEILLDTGGGMKQAASFFRPDLNGDEPFLLHNVDVLSNIDFAAMLRHHRNTSALATLAVQDRPTSRYLLFDEAGHMCGRRSGLNGPVEQVHPARELHARAFSGIHIISPRIFDLMHEEGVFSIVPVYLRLAAAGESIISFAADQYYWRDLGRPEQIAAASRDIADASFEL